MYRRPAATIGIALPHLAWSSSRLLLPAPLAGPVECLILIERVIRTASPLVIRLVVIVQSGSFDPSFEQALHPFSLVLLPMVSRSWAGASDFNKTEESPVISVNV
jgi:hypothetical protein